MNSKECFKKVAQASWVPVVMVGGIYFATRAEANSPTPTPVNGTPTPEVITALPKTDILVEKVVEGVEAPSDLNKIVFQEWVDDGDFELEGDEGVVIGFTDNNGIAEWKDVPIANGSLVCAEEVQASSSLTAVIGKTCGRVKGGKLVLTLINKIKGTFLPTPTPFSTPNPTEAAAPTATTSPRAETPSPTATQTPEITLGVAVSQSPRPETPSITVASLPKSGGPEGRGGNAVEVLGIAFGGALSIIGADLLLRRRQGKGQ